MDVNKSLYNYSSQNRWIPVAISTDLALKYYHSQIVTVKIARFYWFSIHIHTNSNTMDKMLTTKCATIAFQYPPTTPCRNQHFSLTKPCDVFNSYIVTNVIRYNLALDDFVQQRRRWRWRLRRQRWQCHRHHNFWILGTMRFTAVLVFRINHMAPHTFLHSIYSRIALLCDVVWFQFVSVWFYEMLRNIICARNVCVPVCVCLCVSWYDFIFLFMGSQNEERKSKQTHSNFSIKLSLGRARAHSYHWISLDDASLFHRFISFNLLSIMVYFLRSLLMGLWIHICCCCYCWILWHKELMKKYQELNQSYVTTSRLTRMCNVTM